MGTVEIVDIIVLAIQSLVFVGVLAIISMLFDRKKHYGQQKEHSAHIEKEVVNQEVEAFKQKIQELKQLVDKQQLGTNALVKDSEPVEQKIVKGRGRRTIPVLVLDAVTDEETAYDSIEAFATEKNLNVSACRSAKNKGHMLKKRYFIE